jgi:hypothetical protein
MAIPFRNTPGWAVGAEMIVEIGGGPFAGTVTVYVTGDGGTQTIGSVGSGLCANEGNGYYTYRPAQAETDYTLVAFTFIGAGAIPVTTQIPTIGAH